MYIFNYDERRVLTTISKVRITVQVSDDGQTSKGTTEAVVMSQDGRELMTIPGGSFRGVRLNAEKPADFEAFVNRDKARWLKVVKEAGITPE